MQKSGTFSRFFFSFFYTVVTFFYIYQVNFSFLGIPPALHSRRIAAIIIVSSALILNTANKKSLLKHNPTYKYLRQYFFLCIFLIVFSYIQLISIGKIEGVHMFDTMMNIVLFGLPVFWAQTKIYSCIDDFLHILVFVTIIQSLFIVACLYNEAFATLMDMTFNFIEEGSDRMQRLRGGYAGGIGCIAAPGAILYSLGLIACSYLYVNKRKTSYLLLFAIFSIISSMIARTGLFFVLVCILYVLKQSNNFKRILSFAIPGIIAIVLIFSFISSRSSSGFLNERYSRYVDLKDNGFRGDFFDGYIGASDTYYPKLSVETFFGTGMLSGKSGRGDVVNVDGGPLRVYSAIGLLLTIFVYLFIIRIMIRVSNIILKRKGQYLLFTLSVLLLMGDFKEPTLFSAWTMPMFFSFAYLSFTNPESQV